MGDDLPLVGSAAGAIFQGGRSGCRSSGAVEEPHHQDRITFDYVVDGKGESPEKPAPVPAGNNRARQGVSGDLGKKPKPVVHLLASMVAFSSSSDSTSPGVEANRSHRLSSSSR